MIFQDPYESLNPRFRIEDIVAEGPRALRLWDGKEIAQRVTDMLASVGLNPTKYAERFPHELSGGERQRVGIASALVMEPEMIIADEPLSMLDVSIRAGILDLFREQQDQRGFSSVYVSHDLSILGNVADRLMVMYLGQAMEVGPVEEVIRAPKHPYTPGVDRRRRRTGPQGKTTDSEDFGGHFTPHRSASRVPLCPALSLCGRVLPRHLPGNGHVPTAQAPGRLSPPARTAR